MCATLLLSHYNGFPSCCFIATHSLCPGRICCQLSSPSSTKSKQQHGVCSSGLLLLHMTGEHKLQGIRNVLALESTATNIKTLTPAVKMHLCWRHILYVFAAVCGVEMFQFHKETAREERWRPKLKVAILSLNEFLLVQLLPFKTLPLVCLIILLDWTVGDLKKNQKPKT